MGCVHLPRCIRHIPVHLPVASISFFLSPFSFFFPLGISEISMPEKDAEREKAGSRLEGVMLAQAAGEDAGLLEVRWIP